MLTLTVPMGQEPLAGIAAEDIGHRTYGIFRRGDESAGRTVGLAGDHRTSSEVAAAFTEALGEEVRYKDVPPDVYPGIGVSRRR